MISQVVLSTDVYLLSRNISTLLITVRAPKLCQKHDMLKNTTLPLYVRHKELIMSDFVLYNCFSTLGLHRVSK